jgi:hypothetical protein
MNESFHTAVDALAYELLTQETRRTFLSRSGVGLGAMALAMLGAGSQSLLMHLAIS